MRRTLILAIVIATIMFVGLSSAAIENTELKEQVAIEQMMRERDVKEAYRQGFDHGVDAVFDSNNNDVEGMKMLFACYSKSDPERYTYWVYKYSIKYGVSPRVLAGMIMQESSCDRHAISSAGAVGLTQIIYKYWKREISSIAGARADLFDPEKSIEAGALILSVLLNKYGNYRDALDHYSGGATSYFKKVLLRAYV